MMIFSANSQKKAEWTSIEGNFMVKKEKNFSSELELVVDAVQQGDTNQNKREMTGSETKH